MNRKYMLLLSRRQVILSTCHFVIAHFFFLVWNGANRTAHIIHLCRKTTVLSCHRHLINSGVEKMNNI